MEIRRTGSREMSGTALWIMTHLWNRWPGFWLVWRSIVMNIVRICVEMLTTLSERCVILWQVCWHHLFRWQWMNFPTMTILVSWHVRTTRQDAWHSLEQKQLKRMWIRQSYEKRLLCRWPGSVRRQFIMVMRQDFVDSLIRITGELSHGGTKTKNFRHSTKKWSVSTRKRNRWKKVLSSYWRQMKICWPMEDLKQMNRLSLLWITVMNFVQWPYRYGMRG